MSVSFGLAPRYFSLEHILATDPRIVNVFLDRPGTHLFHFLQIARVIQKVRCLSRVAAGSFPHIRDANLNLVRLTGIEPACGGLESTDNPSCPKAQIFGEGGGNRTPDTRFWRPLLYH